MAKNRAKIMTIVFTGAVAAMGVGARRASADTTPAPGAGVQHAALSGDRSASHGDDASKSLRCPAHVPAALDPPAGTTLAAGMAASGVQVYVCAAPAAAGAPAWVLKAPHAVLSEGKETTATHFSGPAPVPPVAAKAPVAASTPAASAGGRACDSADVGSARRKPAHRRARRLGAGTRRQVDPVAALAQHIQHRSGLVWRRDLGAAAGHRRWRGAGDGVRLGASGGGGDGAVSRGLFFLSSRRGGQHVATVRIELSS